MTLQMKFNMNNNNKYYMFMLNVMGFDILK